MIDNLPPVLPRSLHGGPTAQLFTGLDFSVNGNPYGPNSLLAQAVRDADHASYPDPTYSAVRDALAVWHGRTIEQVALGVGASELLHRLVRALVPPGGQVLSWLAPFGELARAAALQRVQVQACDPLPEDLPPGTALVYVGHPHNPTGRALEDDALLTLAGQCAARGAFLLVDEAYLPFTTLRAAPAHASVIRLLSPGKAHGLLGVRAAYALADAEVVARLENLAPAWHLPAGGAALLAQLPAGASFLAQTLPRVQHHARELAWQLSNLAEVEHHGAPFMTVRVGDAAPVAAALLERQVRVRDCGSYGFPDLIRVSARLPGENAVLRRTLRDVLARGGRHG